MCVCTHIPRYTNERACTRTHTHPHSLKKLNNKRAQPKMLTVFIWGRGRIINDLFSVFFVLFHIFQLFYILYSLVLHKENQVTTVSCPGTQTLGATLGHEGPSLQFWFLAGCLLDSSLLSSKVENTGLPMGHGRCPREAPALRVSDSRGQECYGYLHSCTCICA